MKNEVAKSVEYFYIWVDANINNSENSEYSKYLIKKYQNIKLYTKVQEAITYFKTIKFHITYIIVSGSLFAEFISKLKNVINTISAVPKIIIFTSPETSLYISKMGIINDSFYNIGGFVLQFEKVLAFLNQKFFFKQLNFIRPLRREKMQTGGEFCFELLDNINDLVGALYLTRLFKEPQEEQCSNFDKYLIDNYGDVMKELISQIFNIKCPISLRIKYWLRAYTLETKFYKNMNDDLMKDKIKLYIPYIQLLYSGLKINSFDFSSTQDLYRGALIKKAEIKNLIYHLKKKKSNIPCGLIYSKSFMSFSLDKNVAMDFMKKKKPTEKEVRVLYILKTEESDKKSNALIYKNTTNADLTDISYFEDEKEILLFPFSIYEINEVQKKENYYIIYLNILVKYKPIFNSKNLDLKKSIGQSKYVKMLQNIGLLPIIWDLSTIVVHFISVDQSVNFSWVCKPNDVFSNIEEKLYLEYPELKFKNLYFLANALMIKRSATLIENNIKDDNVILINTFDEF